MFFLSKPVDFLMKSLSLFCFFPRFVDAKKKADFFAKGTTAASKCGRCGERKRRPYEEVRAVMISLSPGRTNCSVVIV